MISLPTREALVSTEREVIISSDGAAAVEKGFFWRPVGLSTPRGVKLQLINKSAGVAVYGHYTDRSAWTHWAPLPKFRVGE